MTWHWLDAIKKMKGIFFCCLIFASHIAFSQKNEISVYIKNGVLINNHDVKVLQGIGNFTTAKNTLTQGIGLSYTRVFKSGLLISTGIEAGYDKYQIVINFPLSTYGFSGGVDKNNFTFQKYIYSAELQGSVGYRFQVLEKLCPEIRIGQIISTPLNNETFEGYAYNPNLRGSNSELYFKHGFWGSRGRIPVFEFVNSIYVGVDVWHGKHNTAIRIGLQAKRRFIFANSNFNYLHIEYSAANGAPLSVEEFNGRHLSINFIAGLVL